MKENTLKNIMLDKSLENSFFHFTKEDNIKSIQKNGLSAVIGQYAKGIEDTPKIFFSKPLSGIKSVLLILIFFGKNNKLTKIETTSSINEKKKSEEAAKTSLLAIIEGTNK